MPRARPSARRRGFLALLATALVLMGTFAVLAPPERCPKVDRDRLRGAATEAVDWFSRNQNADGTWLYEYQPAGDRVVPDYNVTRHSGAIMGLYQAAAAGIDGALRSADAGVGWSLPQLVRQRGGGAGGAPAGDWAAVPERGLAPVGASALLAAGLVERRLATGDARHDDTMVGLGRFMASMVEPSGTLLAYYDIGAGRPLAGHYSKYYTGEAWWALGRLHRLFPDAGFGGPAQRLGGYIAEDRDEVEYQFPPLPDHWAAYGLAETVEFPERRAESPDRRPLTEPEITYARRQAGLFGAQARWVAAQSGPWGAWVRGPDKPRGGGYGVVGEALTGLWRTSLAEGRLADLRRPLADRATCIAALAIDEQRSPAEAATATAPGRVRGAWFIDGTTRMDDQQHALSALLRTEAIVAAAGPASGRSHSAPAAWLWLIGLVAALNPARLILGAPRPDDPDHPDGPGLPPVVAVGATVGLMALALVALAGDALLDAIDVSAPAARIAAGVVAAALGLSDLVRRPARDTDAALGGWGAALVPVALPLVIRPALVVLALSAGADSRAWVVVAAVLVGGGLAAVGARRPPSAAACLALAWAGRLAGAVLVTVAVALVVNGVFDV